MSGRTNGKKRSSHSPIQNRRQARHRIASRERKAAVALIDLMSRVRDDVTLALVLFGVVDEMDQASYERQLVLDYIRSVVEHARAEFAGASE